MMSEAADIQAKYADPSYNSLIENVAKSQGYDVVAITSKFLNDKQQFTENLNLNPDLMAQYDALSAGEELLNERMQNEVYENFIDKYEATISEYATQLHQDGALDKVNAITRARTLVDNEIGIPDYIFSDKGGHYVSLVATKVQLTADVAYNAGDEMDDLQKSQIYQEAHSILTEFRTLPVQLSDGRDARTDQHEYIENLSGYSEDYLYNAYINLHPDYNIEIEVDNFGAKSKPQDSYNSFSDQLDYVDKTHEAEIVKQSSIEDLDIKSFFAMSANSQTVLQQEAEMTFAHPKGLNA